MSAAGMSHNLHSFGFGVLLRQKQAQHLFMLSRDAVHSTQPTRIAASIDSPAETVMQVTRSGEIGPTSVVWQQRAQLCSCVRVIRVQASLPWTRDREAFCAQESLLCRQSRLRPNCPVSVRDSEDKVLHFSIICAGCNTIMSA